MFYINLADGRMLTAAGCKSTRSLHLVQAQQQEVEFAVLNNRQLYEFPANACVIIAGDVAENNDNPMFYSIGTVADDRKSVKFIIDTNSVEYQQRVHASATPCWVDIFIQYDGCSDDFMRLVRFSAIADLRLCTDKKPVFYSQITAKETDVLAGIQFIDNTGTLKTGSMMTVTPVLDENIFSVGSGFIEEPCTLTVASAEAPYIKDNTVSIYKGYHNTTKKITIGNAVAAQTYFPAPADQIIPAASYLTGAQILKGDANFAAENIAEGVTLWNVIGTHRGGSDIQVTEGYIDNNGNFQALDLSGDTPLANGEAETITGINTYKTGLEEPTYLTSEPVGFYRCAFYDDGGIIPAYTNLNITGITDPENVNGEFKLVDITSSGLDREWCNGSFCCGYDAANKKWLIASESLEYENALFYADADGVSSEDGTKANPVYWSTIVDSADNWKTQTFDTADSVSGASDNYRKYIYVKLLAGTPYSIGMTSSGSDNKIFLYDSNGTELTSNDDGDITINEIACKDAFTYTPTESGLYIIGAGAFSTDTGETQVICFPAPEAFTPPASDICNVTNWTAAAGAGTPAITTIEVSERPATGIKKWSGYKAAQDESGAWLFSTAATQDLEIVGYTPKIGNIYNADTTIEVKRAFDGNSLPIPNDGLTFYAPLENNYTDLAYGLTPSSMSGTFATYNGISALYFDGNTDGFIYPATQNFTSANGGSIAFLAAPAAYFANWVRYVETGNMAVNVKRRDLNEWGLNTTDGVWQSIILTTDANSNRILYLNGTKAAEKALEGTSAGGKTLYIATLLEQYFSGYIARVAVYDRELSAAEALEIHNALMEGVAQ